MIGSRHICLMRYIAHFPWQAPHCRHRCIRPPRRPGFRGLNKLSQGSNGSQGFGAVLKPGHRCLGSSPSLSRFGKAGGEGGGPNLASRISNPLLHGNHPARPQSARVRILAWRVCGSCGVGFCMLDLTLPSRGDCVPSAQSQPACSRHGRRKGPCTVSACQCNPFFLFPLAAGTPGLRVLLDRVGSEDLESKRRPFKGTGSSLNAPT